MDTLQPGQLVVFRMVGEFGIGRIEVVRETNVTTFPWLDARRDWSKLRRRIRMEQIVNTVPEGMDPAELSDRFNMLANMRDAFRRRMIELHDRAVCQILEEGAD
ncbi:MAG: hypothetical protein IE933_03410 [Sphingomonadales bacterium]|nr:hypothetical protein [Sphingomonadales bacterium]MBD3772089.1 hypothetical protein [Paracoccaceae bacterium]